MIFYADTSFLVSIYLADTNTAAAERLMLRLTPEIPLTDFGAFELRNAIWSAVFRKTITISAAEAALRQIERDSADDFLEPTPCGWKDILRTAESLSRRHTYLIGCRALDTLHIASAVVLGCREFLTFDQRQLQLARQVGLETPA